MEKVTMTIFLHISAVFLFLVPVNLRCQEVNEVQLSLKSYARWLERMNISQSVLCVDTIETDADKAVFYLKSDCDEFAWKELDSLCKTQTHTSFSNLLINRLRFDVDKPISKDKIVIDGNGVLIIITQPKDSVVIKFFSKLGIVPGHRAFALNDIHFIFARNQKTYNIDITIEKIRRKLAEELRLDLKKYNHFCGYIAKENEASSSLSVKFKIKGTIIPKHQYWENVVIIFHFSQYKDKLNIEYDVDGTYASGRGSNEPADSEFANNRIDDTLIVEFNDQINQLLDHIIIGDLAK